MTTTHPSVAAFGASAGELTVGGVPLGRLAARVGSTPFFAYDRSLITRRVELLRRTLPERIQLGYAVKANPMPAVVQHLSGLVDALDVASAGELAIALDTPTPPTRISFAGPGKTAAELRQAVPPVSWWSSSRPPRPPGSSRPVRSSVCDLGSP